MTDISSAIAGYWDAAASSFDEEPDHGLRAERTRGAWSHRLREWAPPAPAEVLDAGSRPTPQDCRRTRAETDHPVPKGCESVLAPLRESGEPLASPHRPGTAPPFDRPPPGCRRAGGTTAPWGRRGPPARPVVAAQTSWPVRRASWARPNSRA
ncbi:hypothetical protein GCM10023079_33490 [Streptomyces chitinivorans]